MDDLGVIVSDFLATEVTIGTLLAAFVVWGFGSLVGRFCRSRSHTSESD